MVEYLRRDGEEIQLSHKRCRQLIQAICEAHSILLRTDDVEWRIRIPLRELLPPLGDRSELLRSKMVVIGID